MFETLIETRSFKAIANIIFSTVIFLILFYCYDEDFKHLQHFHLSMLRWHYKTPSCELVMNA